MKNKFEDVPPQIIILNEEATSPQKTTCLNLSKLN